MVGGVQGDGEWEGGAPGSMSVEACGLHPCFRLWQCCVAHATSSVAFVVRSMIRP